MEIQESFNLPENRRRVMVVAMSQVLYHMYLVNPYFPQSRQGVYAMMTEQFEDIKEKFKGKNVALTNDLSQFYEIYSEAFIQGYEVGVQLLMRGDRFKANLDKLPMAERWSSVYRFAHDVVASIADERLGVVQHIVLTEPALN